MINTIYGEEQDSLQYKGIENNNSVYSRVEEMHLYPVGDVALIN